MPRTKKPAAPKDAGGQAYRLTERGRKEVAKILGKKRGRRKAFTEEDAKKIAVFSALAKAVSENWPGWELIANAKEKEPYPRVGTPVRNVALYKDGKLMGFRLLDFECSACRLMQDACGAFMAAMQRAGEEK